MSKSKRDPADLLRRLKSREPGSAWAEFMHLHAALIMKTVLRFEYEEDRKNDCFLYVCEKLAEKRFRRIGCYRPQAGVEFGTWLTTVVFHLCIDWHRKEFGRATLLPAVSSLPAFDRWVYRSCFEQGLSITETQQALQSEFPEATRAMVSQALNRIHGLMTPRQRWQASVRLRRCQQRGQASQREPDRLPSPVSDPYSVTRDHQRKLAVDAAMRKLPDRHRLLLQLRFQEGLTLRQIADFFELGDCNRAWRSLQQAMQSLAQHLPAEESRKSRKK